MNSLAPTRPESPESSIFDPPHAPPRKLPTPDPRRFDRKSDVALGGKDTATSHISYVVVSGGTGCNALTGAFGPKTTYVLPVSDDGGSSAEIIRVLGGPSIGDIRSRLIRLIPPARKGSADDAIRTLLAHRFPGSSSDDVARSQWRDILEGRSWLWKGIPADRKETIRGFLVYFEGELLRRAQKNFSFVNGSVGNYFLAGAQMFFRSLPSAIFLFSSITNSQATILPVIVTNHTVTLAAELENGTNILGQCEISHPVPRAPTIALSLPPSPHSKPAYFEPEIEPVSDDDYEDADNHAGSVISTSGNVRFEQSGKETPIPSLPARIKRVFYINTYGQEIHPAPNRGYTAALDASDVLVYSCGSLWTSVMPTLCLRGVAQAIAGSHALRAKVLLLNSENDRETDGYTAVDYVSAIVRTLNSQRRGGREWPTSAFVTHLVYLEKTSVAVDEAAFRDMGVSCVCIPGDQQKFEETSVAKAMAQILSHD